MNEVEALKERLKSEVQESTRDAEECGYIDELIKHPGWTKVLRPLLNRQVKSFETVHAWGKSGTEFEIARAEAGKCTWLIRYIECRVGRKESCEAKASAAVEKLESLEKHGRIIRNKETK